MAHIFRKRAENVRKQYGWANSGWCMQCDYTIMIKMCWRWENAQYGVWLRTLRNILSLSHCYGLLFCVILHPIARVFVCFERQRASCVALHLRATFKPHIVALIHSSLHRIYIKHNITIRTTINAYKCSATLIAPYSTQRTISRC